MKIKRIAVYCGSSVGDEEIYKTQALALVQAMHKRGYGLVYGGGNVGIMGIIADEMLRFGGEVIGVIPKRLMDKEVGHTGLTQQIVVDSMHERKAKMFELC
ncbi:MAG: LOG family protein, partial [Bacteroidia bacterium]